MIHCPGFLQSESLARWYVHAGAFVLPSVSEPWGLVVNEAAASGLPLLVSISCGLCTYNGSRAPRDDWKPIRSARCERDIGEFDLDGVSGPQRAISKLADEQRIPSLTGHRLVSRRAFWKPSISPKDLFACIAVLECQAKMK